MTQEFSITFWGTRGSLASPADDCSKAGGNTACVEVRCGKDTVICDAGTGIRLLGNKIKSQKRKQKIHILLSHAHYDHVEGIPFFAPFFSKDYKIDIWCGKLVGASNTYEAVKGFMRRPYFPVGPEVFQADVNYHMVGKNKAFDISDKIRVETIPLEHPGGATAYKVMFAGKSFAYVTDTEHKPGKPNQRIVKFLKNVDAFVYDATLTDEELPNYTGYGHSTWQEGLRLAELAGAKRYFAFHHAPLRCDADLDKFESHINKKLPGSGVAREGKTITL